MLLKFCTIIISFSDNKIISIERILIGYLWWYLWTQKTCSDCLYSKNNNRWLTGRASKTYKQRQMTSFNEYFLTHQAVICSNNRREHVSISFKLHSRRCDGHLEKSSFIKINSYHMLRIALYSCLKFWMINQFPYA